MNKMVAVMSLGGFAFFIIAVVIFGSMVFAPAPSPNTVADSVCATLDTYPQGSQAKADARQYVKEYYNVVCP